jgi:hypothetical protein
MRSLLVVVQAVLTQDCIEVPLIHDQHPVQALSAAAPDPAFSVCVRHRRPYRGQDYPGTFRLEHRIGLGRELLVAIVDYNPQRDALFVELPAEIAGVGFENDVTRQPIHDDSR